MFNGDACLILKILTASLNYLFISERSKLGLDSNCIKLRKHISKSTSELSYNGSSSDMSAQKQAPQRVKSAGTASVTGVLQRTHGFFSTLRVIIRYIFLKSHIMQQFDFRVA